MYFLNYSYSLNSCRNYHFFTENINIAFLAIKTIIILKKMDPLFQYFLLHIIIIKFKMSKLNTIILKEIVLSWILKGIDELKF
jgi:hypothetical protein